MRLRPAADDKNAENPLPLSPVYRLHRLPNIAREGVVYLTYVVEHYDALSDLQLFIQDDLGKHVGARAVPRLESFAVGAAQRGTQFELFPASVSSSTTAATRCRDERAASASGRDGVSSRRGAGLAAWSGALEQTWGRSGGGGSGGMIGELAHALCLRPPPPTYSARTGAFFIATRKCLRQHSLRFWQRLLAYASAETQHEYVLEGSWQHILSACTDENGVRRNQIVPNCSLASREVMRRLHQHVS